MLSDECRQVCSTVVTATMVTATVVTAESGANEEHMGTSVYDPSLRWAAVRGKSSAA